MEAEGAQSATWEGFSANSSEPNVERPAAGTMRHIDSDVRQFSPNDLNQRNKTRKTRNHNQFIANRWQESERTNFRINQLITNQWLEGRLQLKHNRTNYVPLNRTGKDKPSHLTEPERHKRDKTEQKEWTSVFLHLCSELGQKFKSFLRIWLMSL